MIVVDTNVIAPLFLKTPNSDLALRLFDRDSDWVFPPLWRSEFRNLLTTMMRANKLTLDQALASMTEADSRFGKNEVTVRSGEVLTLAQLSGCTAYDCEFVAAAKTLGVPLITMDNQVLKAFPETAISLVDYAGPPPETEDEEK